VSDLNRLQLSALDSLAQAGCMIAFAFADYPGVEVAVLQIMKAGKSLGMTKEQAEAGSERVMRALEDIEEQQQGGMS
jgi:CMP-2-keto-3-deoxyoctulosonic acid synthetase